MVLQTEAAKVRLSSEPSLPGGDWRRRGKAGGYDYVIVNGAVTHQGDRPTGVVPGHLVRPFSNDDDERLVEAAE